MRYFPFLRGKQYREGKNLGVVKFVAGGWRANGSGVFGVGFKWPWRKVLREALGESPLPSLLLLLGLVVKRVFFCDDKYLTLCLGKYLSFLSAPYHCCKTMIE